MRIRWFIFLAVFLIQEFQSAAQSFEPFHLQFTKKDGLPSNLIYDHIFDQRGILWIATDAGLTRFDGAEMRTYTTEDGLPSNDIFHLFLDKKNRIWMKSLRSEPCYILNDQIHTIHNDDLLKRLGKLSWHIFQSDAYNQLWGSSQQNNLILLDSNDQHTMFPIGKVISDIQLYKDVVIVSTDDHVRLFNLQDLTYQNIPLKPDYSYNYAIKDGDTIIAINQNLNPIRFPIKNLMEGKCGPVAENFCTNYKDSFFYYARDQGFYQVHSKTLKQINRFLPNKSVSKINKDSSGNLWVGTHGNGLFKINTSSIKVFQNSSNSSSSFRSIFVNKDVIIAGNDQCELLEFNRSTLALKQKVSVTQKWTSPFHILSINQFGSDYLVTANKNIFFSKGNPKNLKMIPLYGGKFNFIIDSNYYGVCTYGGVVLISSKNMHHTPKMVRYPKRMYSSTRFEKTILLGGEDSIYKMTLTNDGYKIENAGFPINYWCTDLLTWDSILIVSTAENGILFLKNNKIVQTISTKNGLVSDLCRKIRRLGQYLIIATAKGLAAYHVPTGKAYTLLESEGLPSSNIFDLTLYQDTIYCATESGIAVIPFNNIIKQNDSKIFLGDYSINNHRISSIHPNTKIYRNDLLSFKINYLNFTVPIEQTFFYRIEELQSNYTAQKDPTINLRIPKEGRYTILVYARSKDGRTSQIQRFSVEIVPHWYQYLWVRLLSFVLLLLPLYYIFRSWTKYLLRKEQENNLLEIKKRTIEIAEWKSTINPHFLFNSLNTMQGLFSNEEFERGNKYLSQFAKILRRSVDQSGKLLTSLQHEKEFIQNYLELEQLKRQNFVFNIRMDAQLNLKPYYIPTLVLQPVLENSLKHGIQDKPHGEIDLHFALDQDSLLVTISDNGKGMVTGDSTTSSKGILLIQSKLQLFEKISGKRTRMHAGNRVDTNGSIVGFQTQFHFPIINVNIYDQSDNH